MERHPAGRRRRLVYSGYERSLFAGKLAKAGTGFKLEAAWEAGEHPLDMSSPVLAGKRWSGCR
ncbi:MAG: hypothetical protein K2V38_08355 [Gemmataceae bacterium]|nr:hypothetical protein [Gemmataceae bacterium]